VYKMFSIQHLRRPPWMTSPICNIQKYHGQLFENLNIMSRKWPLEESSPNIATKLMFRMIWPRFTRLSSNNTILLNRPSYESKPFMQISSSVWLFIMLRFFQRVPRQTKRFEAKGPILPESVMLNPFHSFS